MTLENAINTFKPHVIENELLDIGNGQCVPITFFTDIFSDVLKLTYEDLMSSDGGVKGYHEFFTRCRDEGLFILKSF